MNKIEHIILVILILNKYNLIKSIRPLKAPNQGAMDKDKDMDMVKDMDIEPEYLSIFLTFLDIKGREGESYKDKDSTLLAYKKLIKIIKRRY